MERLWLSLREATTSSFNTPEFTASWGWFDRFRKHANLHIIGLAGEVASADQEAASMFPDVLSDGIQRRGFTVKQVFNIDETGLYNLFIIGTA
ncbi:Tigger transposable element-derived protein 1-like 133 [Homarus americanus]|uniref:Tigger transposable element-derived protein 1-like 133 n=1 Tax=Homarus americanus TaxID=6706 RepID=A0A8J5NC29_HOMAM|nr:Tigger transposable element-derived protein 1-like 133 [Homarus americanus]